MFGKAASAGLRGLIQAAIIDLIAWALQIQIRWEAGAILGVMSAVVLGSASSG